MQRYTLVSGVLLPNRQMADRSVSSSTTTNQRDRKGQLCSFAVIARPFSSTNRGRQKGGSVNLQFISSFNVPYIEVRLLVWDIGLQLACEH